MKIEFFDTHTHVQFDVFDNFQDKVIERALKNKVGFINIGTNKITSQKAVILAEKYLNEPIYSSVGLHPIHTFNSNFQDDWEIKSSKNIKILEENFDFDFYYKLALNDKVLAIGECGLDYYYVKNEESIKKQQLIFIEQIKLAFGIKKPLMIHCRNAYDDLILILNDYKNFLNQIPGVIHFFSGKKRHAKILLDLNFYFSFGGVITLTNSYYDLVKFLPIDRILTETDAPYVTPLKYKSKINEPLYVKEVLFKIAEIKRMDINNLKTQILINNKEVFKNIVFD